jgi:hypothetical protein
MTFHLLQRLESGHIRSHDLPTREVVSVSENDALCLWLQTDEPLPTDATVWLSDAPFPVEAANETGLYQAAFWYNAEGNQTQQVLAVAAAGQSLRFCKPLMNRFGQCRVSYQPRPDQSPVLLLTAEVESAKLRPDELTDLLDYLVSQGVSYWRAEAGLTSVSVGETAGPLPRLGQLQRDLAELERLWPQFAEQPLTRLEPRPQWTTVRGNAFSERTMLYLIQHPEALSPAPVGDADAFRWRRHWLSANYALTDQLSPDTDTPENRAIHGYLNYVLDWLRQEREPDTADETAPNRADFQAGRIGRNPQQAATGGATVALLRQWQRQRYARRLNAELDHLSQRVGSLLNRWQTTLPVQELVTGLPPGLAGFTVSDHYFRAGQVLLRWYDGLGETDDDTDSRDFSGVQTLDRLYELLCLFKIQEVLTTLGYGLSRWEPRPNTLPDLTDDDRTGSYYFAHADGHRVRLHYETVPDTYVNVGRVNGLLPDFILEYLPATGDAIGLILDAKYRRLPAVRLEQADLTLKYLHGLVPKAGLPAGNAQRGSKPTGPVRTDALLILHPTDPQAPTSYGGQSFYQKNRYDLFGMQVSRPLIGTVEVAASGRTATHLERVLRALLTTEASA